MLYVFDQQKKTLIMIDYRHTEKWCKDTLVLMYAMQTLGFNLQYMAKVNVHIPR
jgi:tRNA(Ile2) C34 agmatinyltransferase TiaS